MAQLYITHPQNGQQPIPLCALKGFRRIFLQAGESKEVTFTLTPEELALTDMQGNVIQKPGVMEIFVGGGQPKHAIGSHLQVKQKGDEYQIY